MSANQEIMLVDISNLPTGVSSDELKLNDDLARIEGELERVKKIADKYGAEFYYIVLTADEKAIEQRIRKRGETDMIERALFLKRKLEAMPENRGHIYDNTDKDLWESVKETDIERYRIKR